MVEPVLCQGMPRGHTEHSNRDRCRGSAPPRKDREARDELHAPHLNRKKITKFQRGVKSQRINLAYQCMGTATAVEVSKTTDNKHRYFIFVG